MRALFTMFAEDVGLLPVRSFTDLLPSLEDSPFTFAPMLEHLWQNMNVGGFSPILRGNALRFNGGPARLRTGLLKLHQLAMSVFNEGSRSQAADLFEFAVDLEDQVLGMMTALKQVQDTLSQVTALYPESLSYAGVIEKAEQCPIQ